MLKRTISFFVTLLLVFAAIPAGAEFIDVNGTKYEKAVQLLCDLDIVEGVSPDRFEPMEQVKRSDAARLVTALSGMQMTCSMQVYSDVPPQHPDYNAIYAATQLGIISGVGEGLYNPDGFISGEQAAKMLVSLAGYKAHAEAAGGYPSGYLTMANRLDLLKGVSMAAPFTKGELALMLYNTLFAVPAEKASYGDEKISFVTGEENLLAQNLKIYIAEGIVEANCYTAFSGLPTMEGEVRIAGKNYIAPQKLVNMMGREVRVYYKMTDADEREIVSFADKDGANCIRLAASDISAETTKENLVYEREEDAKPETVSLSDARVLWNGCVLSPYKAEDLKPAQGFVTVWESAFGKAILVEIESYQDFIVDDNDIESCILSFKDNAYEKKELDYGDNNVKYIAMDKNGEPSDLSALTAGTVVSLMESRDKKVCSVYVSAETVNGKVTEKTTDSLVVNGKEYRISGAFGKAIPEVGQTHLFRLNFAEEIVSAEEGALSRNYAYLMMGKYEGKGLAAQAKVKLLTKNNEIRVCNAAQNITVNGILVGKDKLFNVSASLTPEQKTEVLKIFDLDSAMSGTNDNYTVEQLIVFEENADGEITEITTAIDKAESAERDPNTFSLHYTAEGAMFLAYSLRMFNSKYRVLTDTPIFTVGNKYTGGNDEEYKVVSGSALEHARTYPGLCLYDMNHVNESGAMVTKLDMGGGATLYNAHAVLVKEVMTVLGKDGEVTPAIRVVGQDGKETMLQFADDLMATFSATVISDKEKDPMRYTDPGTKETKLPDEIPVSKLLPGDIIKYTEINGEMTSALVCFRAASPTELEMAFEGTTRKWPSPTNDYYTNIWLYAKAEYAEDTGFRFYAKSAKGEYRERVHTYGSATILIFDTERGTVRTGNKTSLSKGDFFFASRKTSAEQLIVIYR